MKMASNLADAIDEEFLACPLCTESFTENRRPKALPCLHTFCQQCLIDYVKKTHHGATTIPCPYCKEETTLPDQGIEKLRTNFLILRLQDTVESKASAPSVHCHGCADDGTQVVAGFKCLECQCYLCDECYKAHKRVRVTKTHRILSITEIRSGEYDEEIRQSKKVKCEKHQTENIEYYCKDDNTPTCIKCNMVKHRNHDLIHLSDAATNEKEQLRSLMKSLGRKMESVSLLKQEATKKDDSLKIYMQTLQDELDKHFERQAENVFQQQDEAKKQIGHLWKQLGSESLTGKENVDSAVDTLKSMHNFMHKLLKGSDAEIVSLSGHGKQRMQQLLEMPTPELSLLTMPKVNKCIIPIVASIIRPKLLWQVKVPLESKESFLQNVAYETKSNKILVLKLNNDDNTINAIIVLDDCGVKQTENNIPTMISYDTTQDESIIITCYEDEKKETSLVSLHNGKERPFSNDKNNPINAREISYTQSCVLTCNSTPAGKCFTITRYTLKGTKMNDFTYNTKAEQGYLKPILADDKTQTVHISDGNSYCVYAFSYEGQLRWKYGSKGNGFGQIEGTGGICIDKNGDLLLSDIYNHRVHVISPKGIFKYFLLTQDDGLSKPKDLCFNNDGRLLVAERAGLIKCYDIGY